MKHLKKFNSNLSESKKDIFISSAESTVKKNKIDSSFVIFIADLVNGTNGAYSGPTGSANSAVVKEYSDILGRNIKEMIKDGHSVEDVKTKKFIDIYNYLEE